jgi:hypothetical protein
MNRALDSGVHSRPGPRLKMQPGMAIRSGRGWANYVDFPHNMSSRIGQNIRGGPISREDVPGRLVVVSPSGPAPQRGTWAPL